MSIRLGGTIFSSSHDPLELARAHREMGYRAAYCPGVSLDEKERIRDIEKAFKAEDVVIGEVSAFGLNMMDRDKEQHKKALEDMCYKLTLADEVGALCCVNIAGFLGTDRANRTHPDNLSEVAFDLTVENVRYIVDTVKPKRAKFALEMMPWIIPDSPDSFADLIKAVDRPGFAAHIDPANIINSPRRYFKSGKLIEECFEKLGKWIVSCHAKDTIIMGDLTVHINEVRAGTGKLDYHTYLRCLNALPQTATLLIEHLKNAEEYKAARDYIFSVGKEIGVSF
jgi:sugar phosphate isomerase/epimerase